MRPTRRLSSRPACRWARPIARRWTSALPMPSIGSASASSCTMRTTANMPNAAGGSNRASTTMPASRVISIATRAYATQRRPRPAAAVRSALERTSSSGSRSMSSELADHARRVACGDHARRQGGGDDGTGSDHGVRADRHALEDLHAHTDEHVVADVDGGHGLATGPPGRRIEIVEVAVEDLDVRAEEAIAADPDPGSLGLEHRVVVELHAVADLDDRLRARDLDVAVARVEQ